MTHEALIAGGGIGGLAAAVAAAEAGWEARLIEQAEEFSEVGAGIQLGPNSTGLLRQWGLLQGELSHLVGRPERLRVRDVWTGAELATLQLGKAFEQRYGAPYFTVHRADLQQALLHAAVARGTRLHTGTRLQEAHQDESAVRVSTSIGRELEADALIGADGLWSRVREQVVVGDTKPRVTGHLAYRGLVRQDSLPERLRSTEVTAWLGPRLHVIAYPVRANDWLNVVCVVEGQVVGDPRGWDHLASASDLEITLGDACTPLRDLAHAVGVWRLWALNDRPPVPGAGAMARGRIALLGDAAHPMRPYLAQGAGMALEDAGELQRTLAMVVEQTADVPTALRRYALNRWQRCARVQRRSQQNGMIFHATGLMRWGRNLSLRLLGERLLDQPWLYGGNPLAREGIRPTAVSPSAQ